jgi:hypothetical protein
MMRSSRTSLAFRVLLVAGALSLAVLPVSPASALPPCGGPWTGPVGTSCTFTVTGATINFGGFAFGVPPTAVGIDVIDPAGVLVGGCADFQPSNSIAACNGSAAASFGPGVYTCIVKGLGSGVYGCSD